MPDESAFSIPLPDSQFEIIYADAPWRFKNWSMAELAKRGEKWARRNGRSPYPVMSTKDICTLPVADISSKNAALFLWATYPKLDDALKVMAAWGFTYKTVAFTWVKLNPTSRLYKFNGKAQIVTRGFKFGLGYWTRGNPEICLFGTRGHPKRVSKCVPNLLISPVGEHSRKPPEARERIVSLMGDLPRIELFARERSEGWTAWGNDVA